jgi:hypothetical protein
MTKRTHRTIAAILNLVVVVGSFEGLISILNLDQPLIYVRTAFIVGLFFILQIVLLYDLHFKTPGSISRAKKKHESLAQGIAKSFKVLGWALWDRCAHFREAKFVKQWLNYLILPGIIFWASISLFFVNFGFPKEQQIFAGLSSIALYLNYFYLKEIFSRGNEMVDPDVFVALSIVKIYASAIVYGASLALIRRYCLPSSLLVLGTFALTFLLVWQALFQHKMTTLKNLGITVLIALLMSQLANLVLVFWGYNYFTAAVFLATCYNLMWAVFHYSLDRSLTWRTFWEILVISVIIAGMVFSVTNFKARILDDCQYTLSL